MIYCIIYMAMPVRILAAFFKAVLQSPDDKYAGDTKLSFDHLRSLSLPATYHLASGRTKKNSILHQMFVQ